MKRSLITLALASTMLLTACGRPQYLPTGPKGEQKFYPTYGLFNQNTDKSDKVCYEVSVGNVVWSIILIESVVMPIYFIGFSLFNPVAVAGEAGCGIDAKNSK